MSRYITYYINNGSLSSPCAFDILTPPRRVPYLFFSCTQLRTNCCDERTHVKASDNKSKLTGKLFLLQVVILWKKVFGKVAVIKNIQGMLQTHKKWKPCYFGMAFLEDVLGIRHRKAACFLVHIKIRKLTFDPLIIEKKMKEWGT